MSGMTPEDTRKRYLDAEVAVKSIACLIGSISLGVCASLLAMRVFDAPRDSSVIAVFLVGLVSFVSAVGLYNLQNWARRTLLVGLIALVAYTLYLSPKTLLMACAGAVVL